METDANNSEIPDGDLKILTLRLIGELDGTFYFRDEQEPVRVITGSFDDFKGVLAVKAMHPMIDHKTAAAILKVREMQKANTLFGTISSDVIAS